jgi:hypothetical protein
LFSPVTTIRVSYFAARAPLFAADALALIHVCATFAPCHHDIFFMRAFCKAARYRFDYAAASPFPRLRRYASSIFSFIFTIRHSRSRPPPRHFTAS